MTTPGHKLDVIAEKYAGVKNPELEIRFTMSPESWVDLFGVMCQKSTSTEKVEQSVSLVINGENQSDRQELFFEKGVRKLITIIRKITVENYYHTVDEYTYKVSLSSENQISAFNPNSITFARIKLRVSLLVIPDWRFDFTYIYKINASDIASQLKLVKEDVFPPGKEITSANFIDHIESCKAKKDSPFVSYEFEAEYVGADKQPANIRSAIGDAINSVMNALNPSMEKASKYHSVLYPVAEQLFGPGKEAESYRNKLTLKQLVNQPRNFNIDEYVRMIVPNIEQYYLSDKADGERCLIYYNHQTGQVSIISADDAVTFKPKGLQEKKFSGDMILDAEVLNFDTSGSGTAPFSTVYLFDVLLFNGKRITDRPFSERETHLEAVATGLGIGFEKKIQVRLTADDFRNQIRGMYKRSSRLYPVDGLIFTPESGDYFEMIVYKWKPPERLTIDFLVMKAPSKMLGVHPYIPKEGHDIYLLFNGINYQVFNMLGLERLDDYSKLFSNFKFKKDYFPIQFSPSLDTYAYIYYHPRNHEIKGEALHEHVVEFGFSYMESNNPKKINWVIHKLRPDRDINVQKGVGFGNDFKVAEMTYQTFQNPVTIDTLVSDDQSVTSYFKNPKQAIYKALTRFNAFCKAQVMKQISGVEWVIDPAAGKGQDMFVLNGLGVQNALLMDIDKDAIEELNKRKYEFDNPNFYVHTPKPKSHMAIYTKVNDLRQPYTKTISSLKDIPLPPKGVDAIVINLSIHYIITDEASLKNVIDFVDALLKPGGVFIFTCFDGPKIFKLLKNVDFGKAWELHDGEVLKYSIIRKYQENTMTDFGQTISVLHPFSNGEHYDENLLNIPLVIKAFRERGYDVRQNSSFADWLEKFKVADHKYSTLLTPNDVVYSSLYSYVSVWKPIG